MAMLQQLWNQYSGVDCRDLGTRQLGLLRDGLKSVVPDEITSSEDGKTFIDLLRKFREAVAETDKLHGENYPVMLNSLLSVGEDGLYSNSLRFIFELIQNVDDCDFPTPDDCRLDMRFDFNEDKIILTYNEVGFTPFNLFAITGIAEAAKNISSSKNQIGEKGIGFKSVFGVAKKVKIRSGWFSFELYKDKFTIPVSTDSSSDYCSGTQMTLYVPGQAKKIYNEIKTQYCRKDALFSRNPLLFLNKLTSLKMYFDSFRSMEFTVSRSGDIVNNKVEVERDVEVSVNLHDYENGSEINIKEQINCSRYTYPVILSRDACLSRYGGNTQVGKPNGKRMSLHVIFPNLAHVDDAGKGALYSFLPTQIKLTVPLVCHVPFKLDASREFVDPQGENTWFQEASGYLSELIDYAYRDWCSVVKENIVKYIPGAGENLFAPNNGKEVCLRRQKSFSGAHYLNLPLFFTIDGSYHNAQEIFCFEQEENISQPIKVYKMMGYQDFLFIPSCPVYKLRLRTYDNVKDKLFRRALSVPSITSEALDYLDSAGYNYAENLIPDQGFLSLTQNQIETIFRHRKLANSLQKTVLDFIRKIKRPKYRVTGATEQNLKNVLDADFELSETPPAVAEYMRFCQEMCICLDIEEDDYLPCYNAVILSRKNPLASFAAFCNAIDHNDTFTIRIKLREASKRLNQCVNEEIGSASDYLRNLREIRLMIKESLGSRGYRSYIDLILKSGSDSGRFIQELLQNADDCDYLPTIVPNFSLTQKGESILVEYNEVGFNRANIRSITAIGESTKMKLFHGPDASIGEKGVGFKTIFTVASMVKIYSGKFSFSLSDREPTIPRALEPTEQGSVPGTKMEIMLKNQRVFPSYDEKKILELCLCLRKLKLIKIGDHTIIIQDSDNHRTITIDSRKYVFKRFIHAFSVIDENALNERRGGMRTVSPEQSIICFVPEKGGLSEYALYNGLPTKHKIKIPMVIDAPFALTTSREYIETESSAWNNIVRRELYSAILSVIHSLKTEERAKIFRFIKYTREWHGSEAVYLNGISDCTYLTSYDFLSKLKSSAILPTFDQEVFQTPSSGEAYRFPAAAIILLRNLPQSEYAGIVPSSIIDVEGKDYNAALNALGCASASFEQFFPLIEVHAEHFIRSEEFRSKLYELLQDGHDKFRERFKKLSIIPVYGNAPESIEYVSWKEDSIFVKKDALTSGSDYYVLYEKILPKTVCERIFGSNINEMNAEWERGRYNNHLSQFVQSHDAEEIYRYLISEFRSGKLQRNNSFAVLYAVADMIPFKNELGEIVVAKLFLCDRPAGYFPVEMLQRLIVHQECTGFAEYMRCSDLSGIHYDDIDYDIMLTEDDVEALLDDYFANSEEILRGFYRDDLLSDALLRKYGLQYLALGPINDNDHGKDYEFPSEPVKDINKLIDHVRELWRTPIEITEVKEVRTVRKGKNIDGSTFDIGSRDREVALRIYTPQGANKMCFCQMCHGVKKHMMIEVNYIDLLPKYYFPQLKIALCLECSKQFEFLRSNETIRKKYIEAIMNASIKDQGTVDIYIGYGRKITFTAKHLAEIQVILLQMPYEEE